jgi:hypothetical protein
MKPLYAGVAAWHIAGTVYDRKTRKKKRIVYE